MMKFSIKVCFTALVLLLAAMPLLACGGAEAPPPAPAPAPSPAPTPAPTPPPPAGNKPPVITSLSAEPPKVEVGGATTLTCTASDPDGDTLSFTWSASDGTISVGGEVTTWKAPDAEGDFVISVTVDDGKGGTTTKELTIISGSPQRTILLEPVTDEVGSVFFTGDLIDSWQIGDNEANNAVRAFFSFDITGLASAEIIKATLNFNTKEVVANPWGISAYLHVDQVDYGERALQGGDFDIDGFELAKFTSTPPGDVDVTLPISRLLRSPVKHRLQVRLRLGQTSNQNSKAEYVDISNASINLIYRK